MFLLIYLNAFLVMISNNIVTKFQSFDPFFIVVCSRLPRGNGFKVIANGNCQNKCPFLLGEQGLCIIKEANCN